MHKGDWTLPPSMHYVFRGEGLVSTSQHALGLEVGLDFNPQDVGRSRWIFPNMPWGWTSYPSMHWGGGAGLHLPACSVEL